MDEAFTYFKKIADAEAHYRSTESKSTSFKKQSTVNCETSKGKAKSKIQQACQCKSSQDDYYTQEVQEVWRIRAHSRDL